MRNLVRMPALTFALLSTLYWAGVQGFWMVLMDAYGMHYFSKLPYFVTWLVSAAPPAVYTIVCVLFCHWFAKRVVGSIASKKAD